MNTLKKVLVVGFLVLFMGVGSNVTIAGETEAATARRINDTITHLEEALKAVNVSDQKVAQEHIKAAGQSSKLIIGGSYEARKQRGTRAITKARHQMAKGNTVSTADSLNEALNVFKSLLRPVDTEATRQGGLD